MAATLIRRPELAGAGGEETLISHITISSCSNYISAYSLTYDSDITYHHQLRLQIYQSLQYRIKFLSDILLSAAANIGPHMLISYNFDLAYHQPLISNPMKTPAGRNRSRI